MTDAAGDDRGEFAAGANRVVYRIGTGANATLGGRLVPGAAVPVSFDVRIGDVQPRFEIVNAAAATYVTQSLRIPLTADSNPVTNVVAAPDVTLTKRHSPEFVAGSVSTIRIVVSNVGNLPTDGSTITVTDPLPDAFTSFANAGGDGWACSIPARTLVCTRSGALADGDSFPPIFIDVALPDPAPASVINTVSVAGGGDVNPDNNTASDVGGTAQAADLRITKIATPSTVLSGATVRFLLTVVNDGPSTAQAVIVDDPLGADYRDATATPSVGSCTAAVRCSLGDLARGESATITIDATIAANATTLTNTATVESPTPDPAPGNNTASASVVVPATADVRLTKTPSTTTPTPGLPNGLTYTIVATNAGPSAATGVVISDGVPADFTPDGDHRPAGLCVLDRGRDDRLLRRHDRGRGIGDADRHGHRRRVAGLAHAAQHRRGSCRHRRPGPVQQHRHGLRAGAAAGRHRRHQGVGRHHGPVHAAVGDGSRQRRACLAVGHELRAEPGHRRRAPRPAAGGRHLRLRRPGRVHGARPTSSRATWACWRRVRPSPCS